MAKNNFATGNLGFGTHRCLLFSGRFPVLSIFLDKNFAVGVLHNFAGLSFANENVRCRQQSSPRRAHAPEVIINVQSE